jgi:hypothetical protein
MDTEFSSVRRRTAEERATPRHDGSGTLSVLRKAFLPGPTDGVKRHRGRRGRLVTELGVELTARRQPCQVP